MKDTSKLSAAILRTRNSELEGFEELYLLTYKDTYADIHSSVDDEEYVWNTMRDVYVQVYTRRANMPEASLLRQWIRILIKDVSKQKGGVDIVEFPELGETSEPKAIEPKANTTLLTIEEQLGVLDEDEDESSSKKRTAFAIAKIVVAAIVAISAVCIVVWVLGLVKDQNPIPSIAASGFVTSTEATSIVVEDDSTTPAEVYGWNDTAAGKRYKDTDGDFITSDWLEYEDNMYYFDENGYMAQGVKTVDGQRYVFSDTGELTSISRSYDKEDTDTILTAQMKQFGDDEDIPSIVADSTEVQDGWIYYLSKDMDAAAWPILIRYKNGEGSRELIDTDVLGYFIYDGKVHYCKDNKMEQFALTDKGTPITGGYQIVAQDGYYYLKDGFGRDVKGKDGYETIDGRIYRVEDGRIKYVKPGTQSVGSYTFSLNTNASDNKIYAGGVPYIEQGIVINSLCTVGNTIFYSAITRIGGDGAPISQMYAANVDTGERGPIGGEFPGAMLNMYYYKDTGSIYMEYAPDSLHSVYGRLAVMRVGSGSISVIDDSGVRGSGSQDMLELIDVQGSVAYCYWHNCSWDGSSSYLTVLSTSPLELSTNNTIPLN